LEKEYFLSTFTDMENMTMDLSDETEFSEAGGMSGASRLNLKQRRKNVEQGPAVAGYFGSRVMV
jgi:hypothetical protein